MSILAELWAFMRVRKNFWLAPYTDHARGLWWPDHSRSRIGGGSVHPYAILTDADSRHLGLLVLST
jgi:hypothetical protein